MNRDKTCATCEHLESVFSEKKKQDVHLCHQYKNFFEHEPKKMKCPLWRAAAQEQIKLRLAA